MAIYAVGDVQGCYDALMRLMEAVAFNPDTDQVWLAGDLVNRGPKSLPVLRWAKSMGEAAVAVLGNHDLHLLAVAAGLRADKRGQLRPILDAPDAGELLDWLIARPLLHRADRWVMVHGGLPPQWGWRDCFQHAEAASRWLREKGYSGAYLEDPKGIDLEPEGPPRLTGPRYALRALTHLRTCTATGRLGGHKGPPDETPAGYAPWYTYDQARDDRYGVIFGHWAAHGLWITDRFMALDTGCVWGRALTAVRLDDLAVTQVECPDCR